MAELWKESFDYYGGDANKMIDGLWADLSSGNRTLSTLARTGQYSLKIDGGATGSNCRRVLGGTYNELFISLGLYLAQLPTSNGDEYPINLRSGGNSNLFTMTVRPDGVLEFRNGGPKSTIVAQTAGPAVVSQTWHHIEVRVVRSDVAGIIELRVDEVEVLNATGLNLGTTDYSQFTVGQDGTSKPNDFYIDDLIIRDTTGTVNNGFEGDLRVATLFPVQDAAAQGWTSRPRQKLGTGVMNNEVDVDTRNAAATTPDAAVLELGSGDYTIEGFFRFFDIPITTEEYVLASKWYAADNERSWRLFVNGPDNGASIILQVSTDGTAATVANVFEYPFVPDKNEWYSIAVSRTSGVTNLFINGEKIGVDYADANTYHDSAATFAVGGEMGSVSNPLGGQSFEGFVDGFRLTVGVGRYTANYTPTSDPLPVDVGGDPDYNSVAVLLNFDGDTDFDQSVNNLPFTYRNNAETIFPDDKADNYRVIDDPGPIDDTFIEAALLSATGTLTFTANALDTEQVVLGSTTYTLQTVLVDAANNVLIGADAAETLQNLKAAINLEAGAGTLYGTATVQNPDAFAEELPSEQMLATARTAGAAGNSVASTTTVTGGSWSGVTLLGGADIPGESEFVLDRLPPEVTVVKSISLVNRGFKDDAGSSEVTVSFVTSSGDAASGAARPMTLNPTYYEDIIEQDPTTLGDLTPASLIDSKIRINRST